MQDCLLILSQTTGQTCHTIRTLIRNEEWERERGEEGGEGGGGGRGRERGEGERGDRGMAIMQDCLFYPLTNNRKNKSHYTHLDKGGEGGEGRGGRRERKSLQDYSITTVHNTLYYHP